MSSSVAPLVTVTRAFTAHVGDAIATSFIAPAPAKTAAAASILDAPHTSPTVYNSGNPITLFCIQAGLIILLARFLGYFLGKIRQPKVIAEVIAGILLGPSVFGRIPGFTNAIFPPSSLPLINLVANLGLILFLFLIGMETDLGIFRRNLKASLSISAAGMIIPFGLGAAVSYGLYHRYIDESTVSYSHFLLFIAVAFSITAFPVLCRILTELQLLSTDVGVTTLAAGVGNDVVGWTLLALTIALTNAGSGVVAVYILLCTVGWALLLIFAIKPLFTYYCRRTGCFEKGVTNSVMVAIVIIVLASAFFTDMIGVHAMFGGFLAGIIMPNHKGFILSVTEKIEDLVAVLFLPLYFTFSGLRTNLGLLNNGGIWGWTIAVVIIAFLSKFGPCFGAAKLFGYTWRESGAIGSLMACKGLVELIVLNIGLSAGILNNSIFAMMVFMALVTTFATTPLTLLFYPMSYRHKMTAIRAGKKDAEGVEHKRRPSDSPTEDRLRSRFAFVLSRLEQLPLAMAFTKLLQTPVDYEHQKAESEAATEGQMVKQPAADQINSTAIDVLRLVELTDRASAVQQASDFEETRRLDPLSQIYSTFAALNAFEVNPRLAVVVPSEFPDKVAEFAEEQETDMVIVPWAAGANTTFHEGPVISPLENLFRGGAYEHSPQYASFVRAVFKSAACDVGLFMDQGVFGKPSALPAGRQHIILPFHGGPDDRAALEFVVQLCRHPGVTATVTRFVKTAADEQLSAKSSNVTAVDAALAQYTIHGGVSGGDTLYPVQDAASQAQSDTADNLTIAHYFSEPKPNFSAATRAALTRVTFSSVSTATPLALTVELAAQPSSKPLMVVTGRGRRQAASHREELASLLKQHVDAGLTLGIAQSSEVRNALGAVSTAVILKGHGSLLVVQARL